MFWGIILKPNTKYKHTVDKAFRCSKAVLEFKQPSDKAVLKLVSKELEFILCYLNGADCPQVSLDLAFERDEVLTFVAEGTANVHVTGLMEDEDDDEELDDDDMLGYALTEEEVKRKGAKKRKDTGEDGKPKGAAKRARPSTTDEDEDEDDSDFDPEGMAVGSGEDSEGEEEAGSDDESGEDDDLEFGSDMESFDENAGLDDVDDEDDSDEEEDEEEKPKSKPAKEQSPPTKKARITKQDNKPKQEEKKQETAPNAKPETAVNGAAPESGKKKRKRNKKKNQGEQTSADESTPAKTGNKAHGGQAESPATGKKENRKGVMIETLKTGNGPVAQPGKNVHVYYRGRLQANNKEFDKCTDGKGFRFRIGGGEVIKGWEIGVQGMKVGEKRRLTVPPNLAYGKEGIKNAIPPNSALVFDVELKAVS